VQQIIQALKTFGVTEDVLDSVTAKVMKTTYIFLKEKMESSAFQAAVKKVLRFDVVIFVFSVNGLLVQ
jgi:hypothetical protein